MSNKTEERIDTFNDDESVEEVIQTTEIPKQRDFYKIPRRFGSIPVDEHPLGYDPELQYQKIYPRIPLPFQKADRVTFGHPDLEPNRLIWGDNLHVMRMLPSNSIDLIYIDPPFFSGAEYNVLFGDQNEVRSFSDIWEGGMPSYQIWLNARILEMKRILKNSGVFIIHLDYHASHYVKIELDKIFASENFRNEIVWKRTSAHNDPKRFGSIHDTLFVYSKTDSPKWNRVLIPHDKKYIENFYRYVEPKTNRRYTSGDLSGAGTGPARKFGDKIIEPPKGRHWARSQEGIDQLMKENKIIFTENGVPRFKRYLDEMTDGQPIQDVWMDIGPVSSMAKERVGYPTQKPEALLERIIKSYTDEGDVVADFFCGGGTTPITAQKLHRRWIACDQSRVAVAITQGRLETFHEKIGGQQTLSVVPDISVEYWGTYEIPTLEEFSQDEFSDFIITAFGGRPSSAGKTIHGYKRNIPIFVGQSKQNSPITKDDVVAFAEEITKTKGKFQGIMLGWSFAQSARTAVEKLIEEGNMGVDLIQISLTDIDSSKFREHVTKLHNEYESYLKFILPPEVIVNHKRLESLTYEFDASESIPLNEGSNIVNVQWDFEYLGRFTPTKGFAYGRDAKAKPLFNVQYKFERLGKTSIACRVQDDLGGEKIYTEIINVK